MKILVPITGELLTFDSGNPDNPVRPLDITKMIREVSPDSPELSDFSYEVVRYDLDNEVVELEVTFSPRVILKRNAEGKVIEARLEKETEFLNRKTTGEDTLRNLLRGHTIDELYQMANEPKLVKPFKKK